MKCIRRVRSKRIRSGDTVIVIAGKSKGHVGKVIRVNVDSVVVEGANIQKKHVKPNPQINQQGGIISRPVPLHISNVAIYNTATNARDKVGFKLVEKDGVMQKHRYFKSNDEMIDSRVGG